MVFGNRSGRPVRLRRVLPVHGPVRQPSRPFPWSPRFRTGAQSHAATAALDRVPHRSGQVRASAVQRVLFGRSARRVPPRAADGRVHERRDRGAAVAPGRARGVLLRPPWRLRRLQRQIRQPVPIVLGHVRRRFRPFRVLRSAQLRHIPQQHGGPVARILSAIGMASAGVRRRAGQLSSAARERGRPPVPEVERRGGRSGRVVRAPSLAAREIRRIALAQRHRLGAGMRTRRQEFSAVLRATMFGLSERIRESNIRTLLSAVRHYHQTTQASNTTGRPRHSGGVRRVRQQPYLVRTYTGAGRFRIEHREVRQRQPTRRSRNTRQGRLLPGQLHIIFQRIHQAGARL